jgi:hypothetical protein
MAARTLLLKLERAGLIRLPPRQRPPSNGLRNLLDRFHDHPDSILAFMRDFSVPCDNNQSDTKKHQGRHPLREAARPLAGIC